MPNPYKIYDRNQGPGWLKGLDKYIETPENAPTKAADAKATTVNYGGTKRAVDQASYVEEKLRARGGRTNRADGGETKFTRWSDTVNLAGTKGAVNVARGLNKISRATGLPYNRGAVGVQANDDMMIAKEISRDVPRRQTPNEQEDRGTPQLSRGGRKK